ncbi:MAG: glucosamine inositolphosphorylceramide transferase family protein [Candidatus Jordarchaeum sp.]|uniref:glucosamine inositolphosphorylceramide transferase family protein n=1 Tax=Candidatus Jordarchaeum sp. TaxID=2823881 RepID=UPI00404974F4
MGKVELSAFILNSEKNKNAIKFHWPDNPQLKRVSKVFIRIFMRRVSKTSRCFNREDISIEFPEVYSYILPDKLDKVRSLDLDFVLCFSMSANIPISLIGSPRHGVWIFHHGDITKYGVFKPYLLELLKNELTSNIGLYKLTENQYTYVPIRKSIYRINYSSIPQHLNNIHFRGASLITDALNNLLNHDKVSILSGSQRASNYTCLPSIGDILKLWAKVIKTRSTNIIKYYFFEEEWGIGLIKGPEENLINNGETSKFSWVLRPTKRYYFADPCLIKDRNSTYVFFEKFDMKKRKGNICYIELKENGASDKVMLSMDVPYHIAYPCVFRYREYIYMTIEEAESNSINLYRLNSFPDKWERICAIVPDMPGLDPTICTHNNLWWLFFVLKEKGQSIKLYIYYSDDLFGHWRPHERNPVKADIQSSRPAGKLFYYKGQLIRPAQDCTISYGKRIMLNRILKLSPWEFEEEPVTIINQVFDKKYKDGVHTISAGENITLVDVRRFRLTLKKFRRT